MTNLLCIVNAWTTFCGRTVRSSVWTLNAALPRWSEASSISLLSGILSCHQSVNQSIILWEWFICNFFFLSTPILCSDPEILLVFPKSYFFPLFLILFFAALSVHSSVSEIYFWLLWQSNILIIFFSSKRLWNVIAIIIYIPITLQWQIPYFKWNHLFLVYFAMILL